MNHKILLSLTALALVACAHSPATRAQPAADHMVEHRVIVAADASATYSFANLAGDVTVVGHDGDDIIIEATVMAESAELAESVRIAQDGNELWMSFPVDEHRDYLYRPRNGGNMNTTTTYRGARVSVSSRGDGIEVSASVRISMPRGAMMEVSQSVGTLEAQGTDGTLTLSTGSGRINTADARGELTARSGSGTVAVEGHHGDVSLRTGSGRVEATGVMGDLSVRTGSGSVQVENLTAATAVNASTGSGSVHIDGNLDGVTELDISTGSGSVEVEATGMPDVQLDAAAGSGSVRVEVNGNRLPATDRNRVEATLGDGNGEARIRTGSGSIRFTIRN